MTITPAIKGQITKAIKSIPTTHGGSYAKVTAIRPIFAKHMPREQAKHAAKRYLSAL